MSTPNLILSVHVTPNATTRTYSMAVASGLAGPVLARQVLMGAFHTCACAGDQ